jgi:hypothetical protein
MGDAMSPILSGHEDLKDKAVVGYDQQGRLLVQCDDGEVVPYRQFIGAKGNVKAVPDREVPSPAPQTQVPSKSEMSSAERRWAAAGVDQLSS